MTAMTPPVLVQGAPRVPLPFGLFSVLDFRPENAAHWQGGGAQWEYIPSDPDLVRGLGPTQAIPSETFGLPVSFAPSPDSGVADDPGYTTALPFTVYAPFVVSPLVWPPEAAQKRASDILNAFEEYRTEQAFWTGNLDNTPNLTDGAVSAGTFTLDTVWDGLGALEQFNADNYGSLGVVHMNRQYALVLLRNAALRVSGNRVFTALGTPVVIGSGYPTGSMKVSPALFGFQSDVFTSSQVRGDLLDKSKNDLYALAMRTYLIGFDHSPVGEVTITG